MEISGRERFDQTKAQSTTCVGDSNAVAVEPASPATVPVDQKGDGDGVSLAASDWYSELHPVSGKTNQMRSVTITRTRCLSLCIEFPSGKGDPGCLATPAVLAILPFLDFEYL